MQARTQELMSFFKSHGGMARFSAILKVGFHPDSLSALEKRERLKRLPGVFIVYLITIRVLTLTLLLHRFRLEGSYLPSFRSFFL